MKAKEFLKEVELMREFQQRYYRTRKRDDLLASIQQEQQVDGAIDRIRLGREEID